MGIRRCLLRKPLFLSAVIVCLSSITVPAAVIDQIAEDFRPLSGYVVKSVGDEYIIDLDKSHGLSTGDLFSVLAAGEDIVHPVTGKVLGTLEKAKAILQATRLKQGYSFARLLSKTAEIKAGDPIRRFENLPAVMWDYTAAGKTFSAQLQALLSGLDWQTYESAQRSRPEKLPPLSGKTYALMFILTENGLEVRGPDFLIIHQYDLPGSLSAAVKIPFTVPQAKSPAGMPEEKRDIRFRTVFKEARTIGNLPGVTLMSDFVKRGARILMATTDGSQIYIFAVTDKVDIIAKGDTPVPAQILALKWWLPAEGEPVYLTVVAWHDRQLASTIFKFSDGHLSPVKIDIPRILGTFDVDGDGRPETLLGQTFDGEEFFGANIRKVILKGGKIKTARPPISFPRRFTVLGSQIADLTGDGKLESVFIRSGILYVYRGKTQVYASPKEMGGTISVLTYEKELLTKDIMTQTVAFEISPVTEDIDGDGCLEVIAVSSHKAIFTAPGITPNVKKTRLVVLKYQDGGFTKGELGEEIEKPIQGLTVSDDRLLFVISEPGSLVGKKGGSHLLGYPLAKR